MKIFKPLIAFLLLSASTSAFATVPSLVTLDVTQTNNGQGSITNNFQCTVKAFAGDTARFCQLEVSSSVSGTFNVAGSWSFTGIAETGVHTFHLPASGTGYFLCVGTTSSAVPNSGATGVKGPY